MFDAEKKFKKNSISPADLYFLTLNSPITVTNFTIRAKVFCRTIFKTDDFDACNWSKLSHIQILHFIQHEKQRGISFNSINVSLAILKGIAKSAWDLELISVEEFMKIKSIKRIRGESNVAGRALTIAEVIRVKQHLSQRHLKATRNKAIFALAVGAGLRRAEIVELKVNDLEKDCLTVRGKGNKTRTVYLSKSTLSALSSWLDKSQVIDHMFTQIASATLARKNKPITIHCINYIFKHLYREAGIPKFTAHDCRRTYATTLFDVGADKLAVQRLMGHTNLQTTQIYDRNSDRLLKEAVKLLPY